MEKRTSRRTRQRRLILEILKGTDSHPTAEWIFARARTKMPRLREIMKVGVSSSAARFDGQTGPHDHLYCHRCGAIMDMEPFLDSDLKVKIADRYHFTDIRCSLIFSGLCPLCRREES